HFIRSGVRLPTHLRSDEADSKYALTDAPDAEMCHHVRSRKKRPLDSSSGRLSFLSRELGRPAKGGPITTLSACDQDAL
ncbi:MAG: hypothetical protein VXY07_14675, partial [Planctomycetota bacterium]|nr:hypothetical protein [Planctomycetota bacterium]